MTGRPKSIAQRIREERMGAGIPVRRLGETAPVQGTGGGFRNDTGHSADDPKPARINARMVRDAVERGAVPRFDGKDEPMPFKSAREAREYVEAMRRAGRWDG